MILQLEREKKYLKITSLNMWLKLVEEQRIVNFIYCFGSGISRIIVAQPLDFMNRTGTMEERLELVDFKWSDEIYARSFTDFSSSDLEEIRQLKNKRKVDIEAGLQIKAWFRCSKMKNLSYVTKETEVIWKLSLGS